MPTFHLHAPYSYSLWYGAGLTSLHYHIICHLAC